MRYYITEKTYRINPDGTQDLRDQTKHEFDDQEGNALNTAEQRFYNHIADDMEFEAKMCVPNAPGIDYLHTQTWSLDDAGATVVLQISITESQMRKNTLAHAKSIYPEGNEEMLGAVLLGDAIVNNEFSDVTLTREKLWRRKDGAYIVETTRRLEADHIINWESEQIVVNEAEAQAWCKLRLNDTPHKQSFEDPNPNDASVQVGVVINKNYKEKLMQLSARTGKKFSDIVNEAIGAYLESC